jgi:uncharacterized membrane protein
MNWRRIFRVLLAVFFITAGANHFRTPDLYLGMMPPWLPRPLVLVQVCGVAQILGGIGVLVTATRWFSGWGLIVLLIAVFPANLHVALQGHMQGFDFSPVMLWLRLPLQLVLISWVWWTTLALERNETLD